MWLIFEQSGFDLGLFPRKKIFLEHKKHGVVRGMPRKKEKIHMIDLLQCLVFYAKRRDGYLLHPIFDPLFSGTEGNLKLKRPNI